ncbi:Ssl1-like-domain-containing protein [Bisporella sp. PMI_857]|nr:Ssl1-like-domain-containing protein [Bisporella sp. PMI_857]
MSDSDGEYEGSDIEVDNPSEEVVAGPTKGTKGRAAWEAVSRSWDTVVETDGNVNVQGIREEDQRKRLLKDTTPLQRGIIRHLVIILDLSFAMVEKDLRPTRYLLTIRYTSEFIVEYFEQNPISQIAIIGLRDGLAVPISVMSGNPAEHLEKLTKLKTEESKGNPSLQNGLEMSRAQLFHTPAHGTREILIIFGALLTSDPGDIHRTIDSLIKDRIRVSVVGLAAHLAICAEMCKRTNAGDEGNYSVALNEEHYRELIMRFTTPPITRTKAQSKPSLLSMGFPSRVSGAGKTMSFCVCHNKLCSGGYLCSRCEAKVCTLPCECPICGLTLILSTHLARSYHHLFPLQNWVAVSWADAAKSTACFACQAEFPKSSKGKGIQNELHAPGVKAPDPKVVSESGRYACPVCHQHFCINCDVFAHEILHNCGGCQSLTRQMSNGSRGDVVQE